MPGELITDLSTQPVTRALLLDLGNVVLEVDFRRTFASWADSAEVDVSVFYQRWQMDDDYRRHEVGELSFESYVESLADRFDVSMPLEDWKSGWNALFVDPFPRVLAELADLDGKLPLYAFTNTNPTHEVEWRSRFPDAIERFSEVFVSSSIGVRKPDHEAYHYVAEEMGYAPEEILFIDDTAENVTGAIGAGFDARLIRSEAEVAGILASLKR